MRKAIQLLSFKCVMKEMGCSLPSAVITLRATGCPFTVNSTGTFASAPMRARSNDQYGF